MSWGAIIGGGLALGGAIIGGNKQNKATQQATDASIQGTRESNALMERMYNQNRQDSMPWQQAGQVGLQEYMANLGLSMPTQTQSPLEQYNGGGYSQQGNPYQMGYEQGVPVGSMPYQQEDSFQLYNPDRFGGDKFAMSYDARMAQQAYQPQTYQPTYQQPQQPQQTQGYNAQTQQGAFDKFRATPGYQFGLDEGRKQIEAGAAARGGLYSGAAMKALQKYGNDYADQQGYTPYMNRLANLANIGQTQAQNNAAMGSSYAQNAGNNLMNAANTRASGLMAQGNNTANMWKNGLGGLGNMFSNGFGGFRGV